MYSRHCSTRHCVHFSSSSGIIPRPSMTHLTPTQWPSGAAAAAAAATLFSQPQFLNRCCVFTTAAHNGLPAACLTQSAHSGWLFLFYACACSSTTTSSSSSTTTNRRNLPAPDVAPPTASGND